jgi:hypothetical protein
MKSGAIITSKPNLGIIDDYIIALRTEINLTKAYKEFKHIGA